MAELLHEAVVDRVSTDIGSALRRRPPNEDRLSGVVRTLAPFSATIRNAIAEATEVLIRRNSFDRLLYAGCIRALAQTDGKRAEPLLSKVLTSADEAGGLPSLSASCFVKEPGLADPLAKVATMRHPHLAFAAEMARAARNECDGAHLTAIAPKIKESHRIALCVQIFVPLSRGDYLPFHVAPGLAVLRDAERHLGRWLVLAELAARAKDPGPLDDAVDRAKNGPSSARSAWALAAWALSNDETPPTTRPTIEIVARLSDRPSADRDTTFLFRLAAVRATTCQAMLEGAAKNLPLDDENAIRSAGFLLRDYGRKDLREALIAAAKTSKREDLRGMAMAVLWDAQERDVAFSLAKSALRSRSLPSAAWASLVHAAEAHHWENQLVDEPSFRRLQKGWIE